MTLKLGMVGLDTSHCPAFVKLLNDPANEFHTPGAVVVKAFPGGSETFGLSRNRVAQFTAELSQSGVAIVDRLADLAGLDGYFLESVDGSQHLDQFRVLAGFGKPVFIDKPLACNYADAKAIAEIAAAKGIPVMTASAIRFARGIAGLFPPGTRVEAAEAFGPMSFAEGYRDYFWYGIHAADVLFSYLGRGCVRVRAVHEQQTDLLIGRWADGRIGTIRGSRFGNNTFGITVMTADAVQAGIAAGKTPYYALMLRQVVPFLTGGKSPIELAESLEIIAFLDAASRSLAAGGEEVALEL